MWYARSAHPLLFRLPSLVQVLITSVHFHFGVAHSLSRCLPKCHNFYDSLNLMRWFLPMYRLGTYLMSGKEKGASINRLPPTSSHRIPTVSSSASRICQLLSLGYIKSICALTCRLARIVGSILCYSNVLLLIFTKLQVLCRESYQPLGLLDCSCLDVCLTSRIL